MKNLAFALLMSAFYLSSCSSSKVASRNYDDVYYSDRDASADRYSNNENNSSQHAATTQDNSGNSSYPQNNEQNNENGYANGGDQSNTSTERFSDNAGNPAYSTSETQTDENGNTYVTNNYYNQDDYYDYAYSSRIRRFDHPYGWGYYDPFYTNMYWYNYDPYSYGVSLYLSYNFWGGGYYNSYGPGISIGFNYGYPYYGGYYGSYYGGYYGGYYGCNNPYYSGYTCGYNNGYYAGLCYGSFNPYYYNSHDAYSYYYGPRGGIGNTVANNTPRGGRNLSELYGRALAVENPRTPRLTEAGDGIVAIGKPKRGITSLASPEHSIKTTNPRTGGIQSEGTTGRTNIKNPGSNNATMENNTPGTRNNQNTIIKNNGVQSTNPDVTPGGSNGNYTPRGPIKNNSTGGVKTNTETTAPSHGNTIKNPSVYSSESENNEIKSGRAPVYSSPTYSQPRHHETPKSAEPEIKKNPRSERSENHEIRNQQPKQSEPARMERSNDRPSNTSSPSRDNSNTPAPQPHRR